MTLIGRDRRVKTTEKASMCTKGSMQQRHDVRQASNHDGRPRNFKIVPLLGAYNLDIRSELCNNGRSFVPIFDLNVLVAIAAYRLFWACS